MKKRFQFRLFLLMAPLVAFLGFAGILGASLARGHVSSARVDADRLLPAFALQPLRRGELGFDGADLIGKVTLVNVFASWCPSCALEQPTLKALSQSSGVPIYGVAWLDAPESASSWLDRYGDPYTRVGRDTDGRLGIDLGVTGAPETFVVDKRGHIRYRQIGPINDEQWQEVIWPMIKRLELDQN